MIRDTGIYTKQYYNTAPTNDRSILLPGEFDLKYKKNFTVADVRAHMYIMKHYYFIIIIIIKSILLLLLVLVVPSSDISIYSVI